MNVPFGKSALPYIPYPAFSYTHIDTKLHYTINSRMELADIVASNPNPMYDSRKFVAGGTQKNGLSKHVRTQSYYYVDMFTPFGTC